MFTKLLVCGPKVAAVGAVKVYCAPGMDVAVKVSGEPTHTGPLFVNSATGVGLTVTEVVAKGEVQPFCVTVREYNPLIAKVALVRVMLLEPIVTAVKPSGPLQLYVAPAIAAATVETVKDCPSQSAATAFNVGVPGTAFKTTVVVACADVQPFCVTVTLYVPAIALAITGFCTIELKPPGPLHKYWPFKTFDAKS